VSARSLVRRLAALQQLLAAALIVTFAGSTLGLASRTLESQESVFLRNSARQMAESLDREWSEEGDLHRAALSATAEDAPFGVQFDVFDAANRRVFSTAPAGRRAPSERRRSVRVPVRRGGWVVASLSTEPRRRTLSALATALALTAVALFIAVTALSRALARRALRPLSRITVEAEEATRRGTLHRLEHPSDPAEVATLARAFDRLFARLDESLRAERHFTQDAAHELRTPLTVLSGELEYALMDESLPERHRAGLHRAWGETRALSELVEALLLLRRADSEFRPEGEEATPVNLGDLARDLVREFAERWPKRAGDLALAAEDEALVAGHPTLLGSAIRNLISNALKFTDAGQPVRVSVSSGKGACVVVVEDSGPGIPPSDRERVFDPFFRGGEARTSHEGFGLGLPILRRVARAHGGDVQLSESPLGGARFEIRLPEWAQRGGRSPSTGRPSWQVS
jgi:signal transduction histidine kinase